MSDSDSDDNYLNNFTPPDVLKEAMMPDNLLPPRSKHKYDKCYRNFMNWKKIKKYSSFTENVLLDYFQELSKKFKCSSLWSMYSMLKSTIITYNKIDISKYTKLLLFLKRSSSGYEGKKAKTFSSEQINKFLNKAPDKIYLATKIIVIFGVMGACRRQELYNMRFKDVEVNETIILVRVCSTKSNTHRSFTITGKYYDMCKKYISLRPNPCDNPGFFLHYFAGQCNSQRVGINKFGMSGKIVAKYLHLPNPELYTGHCFRRTSLNMLVDVDGDITALKHSRYKTALKRSRWGLATSTFGNNDDPVTKEDTIEIAENEFESNYKLNLQNIVANACQDGSGTREGCKGSNLSEQEKRFLAVIQVPGFEQTAPGDTFETFPNTDLQQPSTSAASHAHTNVTEDNLQIEIIKEEEFHNESSMSPVSCDEQPDPLSNTPASAASPPLPRRPRRMRYRTRPMAPLEEARRILAQVQKAAANNDHAQALDRIGHNLGRLADVAERYLAHVIGHK